MREIAANEAGRYRRRRAALSVAAVLALAAWACGTGGGGGGVAGPVVGEADPLAAASVAGTWSGGSDSLHVFWWLTQEGESVSGTGQVSGDGRWTDREGRVVGNVNGSSFSFSHMRPTGTPTTASCVTEFEGTLQLRSVPAPAATPPPPYPPSYPIDHPSTTPRKSMSGLVEGTACGRPFSSTITLFRD